MGMQTWIAIIALANGLASSNIPEQPQWRSSYSEARQWAVERSKPLAVFIGSGTTGWSSVSRDGNFDPKVYQLLKDKYVCVYVDTNTESGKSLAKEFAVDKTGLVIGDKSGRTQAFYHNGNLSNELLAKAFERYAENREVKVTETVSTLNPPVVYLNVAPVTYSSVTPAHYQSTCPNCPNYVPSYAQSYSNCPNGNCPKP